MQGGRNMSTIRTLRPKASALEKFMYGVSGLGMQFVWSFFTIYITMYYTNTIGIAAAAVGTMMLLSRLLDGVSDIICAWLFKKCHFKMGKIRPWFIISGPLLAISIIMVLNVPESFSDSAKFAWVFATYAFTAAVSYTVANLAWAAIMPLMSYDDQDRVSISSFGMLMVMVGVMILQVLTPALLALFGGTLVPGAWAKMSYIYVLSRKLNEALFVRLFCVKTDTKLNVTEL